MGVLVKTSLFICILWGIHIWIKQVIDTEENNQNRCSGCTPWFCLTGNCIITQFGTLQHLLYPQFSARMVTNYRQGSVGYTVFLIRRESLCHFLTVIRIQFLHSISQCRKKGNRFPGTFRLANGSIILICPASCIILQWRHSGFIFNCRFYPDSRLQIEKQNRILDRINPAITTF